MAPEEFELPRFVEGGWIIGGEKVAENPRWWVPLWAEALVRRWAEMRSVSQGMLGGAVLLPVAGGYGDQPALAMDAARMFDGWLAERRGGDGS